MENDPQITIPQKVLNILKTDKSYFGLNSMNELYSRVIKNMYKDFPINKERLGKIKEILQNKLSGQHPESVIKEICAVDINLTRLKRGTITERITLKVTNYNEKTLDTLDSLSIEYDLSLVAILREFLIKYSNLRLLDKERIILKQEIKEIEYAILKRFEVEIMYKGKSTKIFPYSLVTPVDDFSLYLVAELIGTGKINLLKFSDIKKINVNEYSIFNITPQRQSIIDTYSNETTVFNSLSANAMKKFFATKDFENIFPYLLEEARNYNKDKIDLVSKI